MSDSPLINLIQFYISHTNLYEKGAGKILALTFLLTQPPTA